MPNDGMVSMLDRWEQQGNPFAVTPRKKKATENDGGPGSGNFNHKGRPGEVGGSSPDGSIDCKSVSNVERTVTMKKASIGSKIAISGYDYENDTELPDGEFEKVGEDAWQTSTMKFLKVPPMTSSELSDYLQNNIDGAKEDDDQNGGFNAVFTPSRNELDNDRAKCAELLATPRSKNIKELELLPEEEKNDLPLKIQSEEFKKNNYSACPLVKKYGLDKKPTVLSPDEFDETVKKYGLKRIYRGVADYYGEYDYETCHSIDAYNAVKSGDGAEYGGGGCGLAYNFTTQSNHAAEFAHSGDSDKNGILIECALKPDANILERDEFYRIQEQHPELDKLNITEYAVMHGYDASCISSTGMYGIYNRGCLIFKDKGDKPFISPDSDGVLHRNDSIDTRGSVGVLVIKDGKILCGIRSGNTAPGCICGPGGHIENGETPEQAAIRETHEEFGITPKELVPIGNGPVESDTGYSPNLFLCTDYDGEPNCTSNEMSWPQFVDLERFANNPPSMFQPFADSIICLLKAMSFDGHEDGGPGSGHFGHESEKGKRGGSVKSHVRLEGCSESTKKLIDEALENPYGFGGVDTEARKQSIRSSLEKDGVKVTVDEDGLSMAFSPKFSYDDCVDANIAMNGYNMLGRKDYIRQCNDAGSEPLLHETPEALQYVDKPDDGNLSIYYHFNSYNALNDDDIVKYGAFDHDQNPNGNEALTKASISAIESLTPEQHEALVDYTQQYGAATYTEINHYLTSPDEEKTGYSDVVAKNAAAITKALDKEIGADCLVSRGQSDLIGIAPDKKLENYVKQISKCNFKNASKLKQALEGKVIQNDAVMSTSAGNSAGDYSACSVQLLLKTPAKAKAVDLSAISAYGTHSEIEKALASAMGQSLSYEHEVAFKPETQYKIESVDIGFRPASAGRKKPSAYVYITGTVLTDDERTDGVFFAGELDDHDV